MRHSTARQKPAGGWHYVNAGRDGGYPLGYCAEHEPHATELEARECYAKWQRDHVRLNGQLSSWSDCVAGRTQDPKTSVRCPNPTKRYAKIEGDGYRMATLCDEHLTIDEAVKALDLDGPAGDAWES